MSTKSLGWKVVTNRVLAGVLGSYAFTWGFSAAAVAALVALGMSFEEAETAIMMLAFLVFPAMMIWAFAATSLPRVWLVLAGGATLLVALAWGLQRLILT